MNKYRNKKVNGYDSKKEARRAAELKLLQRQGHISDLREQVPYVLIPSQYEEMIVNGRKKPVCVEKQCKYIADFVYLKDGKTVVEDTKGFRTSDYIIKRKLMLKEHKIKIKEV